MNSHSLPINPFYAARRDRRGVLTPARRPSDRYAKLPQAPVTTSPVPHLTSLYHNHKRGPYGDRSYPGNCSGHLIRDLMLYYSPKNVADPMSGSGTCQDVCRELGIPCWSGDLNAGQDACDPASYPGGAFDFVWLHPPYWRQKLYSTDPRDLSRSPTLGAFLDRYRLLIQTCASILKPGGKLVVLVGDYTDRQAGFVPLVYHTKALAFASGFSQYCTDIIRFSHGASSSRKVYLSSFIPGLHDVCMTFERQV